MKKIILATIIALLINISFAQYRYNFNNEDIRPVNLINLDILGESSLISLNYERLFLNTSNFFLAAELGLGLYLLPNVLGGYSPIYLSIPHHITANLGVCNHFLEFGAGGTFNTNEHHNYIFYVILGYRLQPLDSDKIYLRIFSNSVFQDFKISPFYSPPGYFFIPFGISVGISI
ncbi:MAG: hypothetical protein NTZ33_11235 [Bacteroidetes bacterium]|nr:hypothetical protein [Bacteroidota bacterium]